MKLMSKIIILSLLFSFFSCKTSKKSLRQKKNDKKVFSFFLSKNSFNFPLKITYQAKNNFAEARIEKPRKQVEFINYIEYQYKVFSKQEGQEKILFTGIASSFFQTSFLQAAEVFIDIRPCLNMRFVDESSHAHLFSKIEYMNQFFLCDKKWLSQKNKLNYILNLESEKKGRKSDACLKTEKNLLENHQDIYDVSYQLCSDLQDRPAGNSLEALIKGLPCAKVSEFLYNNFKLESLLEAKSFVFKQENNDFTEKLEKNSCSSSLGVYNQSDISLPPYSFNYSCLYGGYQDKWLEAALYVTLVGAGGVTLSALSAILLGSYMGVKVLARKSLKKIDGLKANKNSFVLKSQDKSGSKAGKNKLSSQENRLFKKRMKSIAKFGGFAAIVSTAGAIGVVSKFTLVRDDSSVIKNRSYFLNKKFIALHQQKVSLEREYNYVCL